MKCDRNKQTKMQGVKAPRQLGRNDKTHQHNHDWPCAAHPNVSYPMCSYPFLFVPPAIAAAAAAQPYVIASNIVSIAAKLPIASWLCTFLCIVGVLLPALLLLSGSLVLLHLPQLQCYCYLCAFFRAGFITVVLLYCGV